MAEASLSKRPIKRIGQLLIVTLASTGDVGVVRTRPITRSPTFCVFPTFSNLLLKGALPKGTEREVKVWEMLVKVVVTKRPENLSEIPVVKFRGAPFGQVPLGTSQLRSVLSGPYHPNGNKHISSSQRFSDV